MSPEAGGVGGPELAVHIVGTDELKARATDVSEQRLTEKLEGDGEGRAQRLRAVARRIWYGNMAREHYLAKYSRQARQEIQESGNLYMHEGLDKSAHDEAMDATVLRFEAEHDIFLHLEAGEERGEALPDDEAGADIKGRLQEVISQFARGDMPPEAFEEEKNRVLADLAKQYPGQFEQSRLYADNLTKIAEQVKNAVTAGEDLERVVSDIKFYIDKAHTGVRTEVEQNRVDKVLEYLKQHHVFTNETAVAGAVSIAYSVARYSARTTLGVVGKLALPGISTGILAGLRESKRLKEERTLHSRERAQGKDSAPGAKRREQMEGFRYETVGAMDLVSELDNMFWEVNDLGEAVERALTPDEIDLGIQTLAQMVARQRLSDRQGIDLIDFSSIDQVEYERMALDVRMAQAKNVLRRQFDANYEDLLRTMGDPEGFRAILEERVSTEMQALGGEIGAKDKLFNDMKRKAVGRAAAKGALIGIGVGTLSQELMAVLRPDEHGLLDSALHHNGENGAHQTLLRHMIMGRDHLTVDSDHVQTLAIGNGAHSLQLPDNIHLVHGSDGSYGLEGPGHHLFADNLKFNADGTLDEHSSAVLDHLGISQSVSHLAPSGEVTEHTVSSADFVAHHADKMNHIKRDGWFDNDTPMHQDSSGHLTGADLNETRLWWGSSTGVDEHGNVVMDVSHMTPDGSFHSGLSADAVREMQEGHLKALVSVSKDTQHMAYEVPINAHGQIIIDPNSDVGRLFESSGGHEAFNGGYVEIAQVTSLENGIEHVNILATHIGEDTGQVVDVVQDHLTPHTLTVLKNFTRPGSNEIDVPPIVPVTPRAGLERMMRPVPDELVTPASPESDLVYYGGMPSSERRRQWRESRSPRLNENPEAELSPREELEWYFSEQTRLRGEEYVQQLETNVQSNPNLATGGAEIKQFVCIPVAGHMEGDNIYRTLSIYSEQSKGGLEVTEVLLHVNWPEDADIDAVNKTLSEIQRAQKDFPDVRISYFTSVWQRSWIEERNGQIYGEVVKRLYDTALYALDRSIKSGARSDSDAVIITADADAKGMNKRLLSRYASTANRYDRDIYYGLIRWGTDSYEDYPGYGVSATVAQALEAIARRGTAGYDVDPNSWGPNSGFRASTLAAVGGADGGMGAGADYDLGARIKAARTGDMTEASGYSGYTRGSGKRVTGKPLGATVTGAWLDSSPDRLLRAYMAGLPLPRAWDDFNSGGYSSREIAAPTGPEDLEHDFDAIVERVEHQIAGLVYHWFPDERLYTTTFNLLFPKQGDVPSWTMTKNSDNFEFHFTSEGKEWLRGRLLNPSTGENYGQRLQRILYESEPPRGSKGKAASVVPTSGEPVASSEGLMSIAPPAPVASTRRRINPTAGGPVRLSSPPDISSTRPRRTIVPNGGSEGTVQAQPKAPDLIRQEGEIRFSNRNNPRDLSETEARKMIELIEAGRGREVAARLASRGLWRRENKPDGTAAFISINKPRTQRVFEALGQRKHEPGVFEYPTGVDEPVATRYREPEIESAPLPDEAGDEFKDQLAQRVARVTTPTELWAIIRFYERAGLVTQHPWGQPEAIPGIDFEINAVNELGEIVKSELVRADARLRESGAYDEKEKG